MKNKRYFISLLCILCLLYLEGCSLNSNNENEDIIDIDQKFDPLVEEVEIIIPGMNSEYKFLFIADNHAIIVDDKDSQKVVDNAIPRIEAFKNKETGMSCADTFSNWIDYANRLNVDGFLMGGDIIDYPSVANISFLEENVSKLHVPYLFILGNHDWTYPWEYFTETAQKEYRPKFDKYTKDNSAVQILEYEDFIILAIDNSNDQINSETLEAAKQVLNMNKPVIIMMHVPMETESLELKSIKLWGRSISIGKNGIYPDEVTSEFIEMVSKEESPVIAVLAGHVHFSDTSILNNKTIQYVTDAAFNGYGMLFTIKGDQ